MKKFLLASVVAALIFDASGCSSAPKKSKSVAGAGSSASTTPGSDSLSASTKKFQQDFGQAEADLGKMESEAKLSK